MNMDNRNLLMTADNAEINSVITAFHKLSERGRAETKAIQVSWQAQRVCENADRAGLDPQNDERRSEW